MKCFNWQAYWLKTELFVTYQCKEWGWVKIMNLSIF